MVCTKRQLGFNILYDKRPDEFTQLGIIIVVIVLSIFDKSQRAQRRDIKLVVKPLWATTGINHLIDEYT